MTPCVSTKVISQKHKVDSASTLFTCSCIPTLLEIHLDRRIYYIRAPKTNHYADIKDIFVYKNEFHLLSVKLHKSPSYL